MAVEKSQLIGRLPLQGARSDLLLKKYQLYAVNTRIDGIRFSISRKPDPCYYKYIGVVTAQNPDHAILQISRRIAIGDIIISGGTARMKLSQGWAEVLFNEKEVFSKSPFCLL